MVTNATFRVIVISGSVAGVRVVAGADAVVVIALGGGADPASQNRLGAAVKHGNGDALVVSVHSRTIDVSPWMTHLFVVHAVTEPAGDAESEDEGGVLDDFVSSQAFDGSVASSVGDEGPAGQEQVLHHDEGEKERLDETGGMLLKLLSLLMLVALVAPLDGNDPDVDDGAGKDIDQRHQVGRHPPGVYGALQAQLEDQDDEDVDEQENEDGGKEASDGEEKQADAENAGEDLEKEGEVDEEGVVHADRSPLEGAVATGDAKDQGHQGHEQLAQ